MATTALSSDFVEAVASEIAHGVERAVDLWMTQFEVVLADHQLTTLGRLNAMRDIVDTYKRLTGKSRLGLAPSGWGEH